MHSPREKPGRDRVEGAPERRPGLVAGAVLALLALVLAVYAPVRGFEFVPYDDNVEVFANDVVLQGLSWQSWREAWLGDLAESSAIANYWKPLSTLSHMVVVELFGLDAGAHHVVNALLHAADVLLLFALLLRWLGRRRLAASLFVAALFAVHPVHLESVAWVAERSDVLGACFWLLAMHAWSGYFRRPSVGRYGLALLVYALGLCAKPTLVTFPLVLLLIQVWPLRRLRTATGDAGRVALGRALLEVLPALALALAASVVTYFAHERIDSTASWELVPLSERLQTMVIGYASYLGLLVWPACIPVLFPLRHGYPWWEVAGALALLLCISAACLLQARRRPWLAVGWLWFLGVIFPVSGIAQAGSHAYASRFLYLSAIGVYLAVARSGAEVAARPRWRAPVAAAGAAFVLALAAVSRVQIVHWRDGSSLFSHALRCTEDNPVMHVQLALTHLEAGRHAQARAGFEQALGMLPGLVSAQLGLVSVALAEEDYDRAEREAALCARLAPDLIALQYKLGLIALQRGRRGEAIRCFERVLAESPLGREARINLASVLTMEKRTREAGEHYRFLLERYPRDASVLTGYGGFLASQGRMREALEYFERALAIDPANERALMMAARARAELGQ